MRSLGPDTSSPIPDINGRTELARLQVDLLQVHRVCRNIHLPIIIIIPEEIRIDAVRAKDHRVAPRVVAEGVRRAEDHADVPLVHPQVLADDVERAAAVPHRGRVHPLLLARRVPADARQLGLPAPRVAGEPPVRQVPGRVHRQARERDERRRHAEERPVHLRARRVRVPARQRRVVVCRVLARRGGNGIAGCSRGHQVQCQGSVVEEEGELHLCYLCIS